MFARVDHHGVVFYRSELLLACGVPHAFSTRLGGVSTDVFATLNLGNPSGVEFPDSEENIAENYRRLHCAAGLEDRRRVWAYQCHGARVIDVGTDTVTGAECRADGLMTTRPDLALAVRYADCAPVLMVNCLTRRVAALHVGWRGATQGIVGHAVRALGDPRSTIAAIGPCIGPAAFEVSDDVLDAFASTPIGRPNGLPSTRKGWLLDLAAAIQALLQSEGVIRRQIDSAALCTFSQSQEFFSERRDGRLTGRMAALVATPKAWHSG